eukprot:TRINITY_DN3851_c0_g1_i1.p1 TRINITY_DN3851_c0_g1~~TRINITY_DN3851_c0_g1_i1.p1  ORF type:complete len:463 (+),score=22.93 TRINITY_DN3851_c0_g1_i1:1-1389(+)
MNITKQVTLCKDVKSLGEILKLQDLDHIHLSAIIVRAGRMIRDESADTFQIQKFLIDNSVLPRLSKVDDSVLKMREISSSIWGLWKCQMLDTKQGQAVFEKFMDRTATLQNYDVRDVIVLLQVLGMSDHGAQHVPAMKHLVKLAHRHVADLSPSQMVSVCRVMSRYMYYQSKVFDDVLKISGQKIADYEGKQIVDLLLALRECRHLDATFIQLVANRITKEAQSSDTQKLQFSPRQVAEILMCFATFRVKNISCIFALFQMGKVSEGWSLGVVVNCLFCLGLLGVTNQDLVKALTDQLKKVKTSSRVTAKQLNYLYFSKLLFQIQFFELEIPEWLLTKSKNYWAEKVSRQKFSSNLLLDNVVGVLTREKLNVRKNVVSENGEILLKIVVKYGEYDIVVQPLLYNCFSSNKPITELGPSYAVRQLWQSQGNIALPIPYFEFDKAQDKMLFLKQKFESIVPQEK